ncbi:MarR family winged helix-turn-helix transcriptional regulator [Aeromicrobium alkaliterrae]|uniref:MarR family transcriptional regulator n=1 Tax=Aeromicrobium alkaliterrae TaxID=302168 RepID=A0ABP4W9Q9_9ACTN
MTSEHDLGPHLRRRLTYLLKRALVSLDELHETHLADSGINVRELGVLLLLADREPGSQQQAAERLGVDRTSMVALLDVLEAKSLVVRRPDAADRRRNVVEITDTGRATLAEATRASDDAERELLSVLGDADATLLRDLLDRINVGGPRGS